MDIASINEGGRDDKYVDWVKVQQRLSGWNSLVRLVLGMAIGGFSIQRGLQDSIRHTPCQRQHSLGMAQLALCLVLYTLHRSMYVGLYLRAKQDCLLCSQTSRREEAKNVSLVGGALDNGDKCSHNGLAPAPGRTRCRPALSRFSRHRAPQDTQISRKDGVL